jgi:hypothetical protein
MVVASCHFNSNLNLFCLVLRGRKMKCLLSPLNNADLDCLFPIKNVSRGLVGIASKYFVGLHFEFETQATTFLTASKVLD